MTDLQGSYQEEGVEADEMMKKGPLEKGQSFEAPPEAENALGKSFFGDPSKNRNLGYYFITLITTLLFSLLHNIFEFLIIQIAIQF